MTGDLMKAVKPQTLEEAYEAHECAVSNHADPETHNSRGGQGRQKKPFVPRSATQSGRHRRLDKLSDARSFASRGRRQS